MKENVQLVHDVGLCQLAMLQQSTEVELMFSVLFTETELRF